MTAPAGWHWVGWIAAAAVGGAGGIIGLSGGRNGRGHAIIWLCAVGGVVFLANCSVTDCTSKQPTKSATYKTQIASIVRFNLLLSI
jgi:hypothetical protein